MSGARETKRAASASVGIFSGCAAHSSRIALYSRRQVVGAEEFVFQRAKPIIGPPEAQERFLLRRVEARRLRGRLRCCHNLMIHVRTTIVQTNDPRPPQRRRSRPRLANTRTAVGPLGPALFTDIEGSARLWQQQPAGMRVDSERHNAPVHAPIEQNAGRLRGRDRELTRFWSTVTRTSNWAATSSSRAPFFSIAQPIS